MNSKNKINRKTPKVSNYEKADVSTRSATSAFIKLVGFNFVSLLKIFWVMLFVIVVPAIIVVALSGSSFLSPAQAIGVALSFLLIEGAIVVFPSILVYDRSQNNFLRYKLSGYKPWSVLTAYTLSFFILSFLGALLVVVLALVVSNNIGGFIGGSFNIQINGASANIQNIRFGPGFRFVVNNAGIFIQQKLYLGEGILILLAFIPIALMFFVIGWLIGSRIKNPRITVLIQIPGYILFGFSGLYFFFPYMIADNPGLITFFAMNPLSATSSIFSFIGGDSWTSFTQYAVDSVVAADPATGVIMHYVVTENPYSGTNIGGLTFGNNPNGFQSIVQLIDWLEIIIISAISGTLGAKYFVFYKFSGK